MSAEAGPPVLVLRALGIGDLATAVPALRGLRASFPQRPLILAAPGWLAPLVRLTGAVDQLLPLDGLAAPGWWLRWPVRPGAVAVNLHGRGPQSHRLLRAAVPARLYAFACAGAGHAEGPLWRQDEHEVRRWCRMLRWYGIGADPADLSLHRPAPDLVPVGATVVHPGAKSPCRRWPAARFAAVARALAASGHRVVVTGSPAEVTLARQVATLAGLPPAAVLAGVTGVGDLAALVAHARQVVCGDTGVAHLATAYRTPSVVLFGPASPGHWGPPPDRPEHRVLWQPAAGTGPTPPPAGTGPTRPPPAGSTPDRVDPALLAISVEQVLATSLPLAELTR